MEKIIASAFAAISSNIDFVALALVILGGLFAKNYMNGLKWPVSLKTLLMGSLFMGIWIVLQWAAGALHRSDLSRLFFTYCVATSLYELILKYAFQWLAARGIKIGGSTT